jgi:DNA-binding transcriptional MerR regulator
MNNSPSFLRKQPHTQTRRAPALPKRELDPGINSRVYNDRVKDTPTQPETLLPAQLARLTGVSTDTLRYYERKGLLKPVRNRSNGYRRYPVSAAAKVRLIRRALAIGMTLDEISAVIKVRDNGGAPCRRVREMAASKLRELEDTAREIESVAAELRSLIRSWDCMLAATSGGEQALLLESFPDSLLTSQRIIRDLSSARNRRRDKKRKEANNEI